MPGDAAFVVAPWPLLLEVSPAKAEPAMIAPDNTLYERGA